MQHRSSVQQVMASGSHKQEMERTAGLQRCCRLLSDLEVAHNALHQRCRATLAATSAEVRRKWARQGTPARSTRSCLDSGMCDTQRMIRNQFIMPKKPPQAVKLMAHIPV